MSAYIIYYLQKKVYNIIAIIANELFVKNVPFFGLRRSVINTLSSASPSKHLFLLVFLLILTFSPGEKGTAWAWTDTGGGNHGGADWTITSGPLTISGTHYNINNFNIQAGVTVYITPYDGGTISLIPSGRGYANWNDANPSGFVEIEAQNITIDGLLEASYRGYRGGGCSCDAYGGNNTPNGEGPGGTPLSGPTSGGAGYGGSGGTSRSGGSTTSGGSSYGTATGPLEMGSGTGAQSGNQAGGRGGGLIILKSNYNLTISNTGDVQANGGAGISWTGTGPGGGSGGGIYIDASTISLNSSTIISAAGGGGATSTSGSAGNNGVGGNGAEGTAGGNPGIPGNGGDWCQNGGNSAGGGGKNNCTIPPFDNGGGGGGAGRILIRYTTINSSSYSDGAYWNPAPLGGTIIGPFPWLTIKSPPNSPSGLTTGFIDTSYSDKLKLDWTDNSSTENGFRLERSTDNFLSLTVATTTLQNTTYYIDTGLTPNTTYWYKVYAFGFDGDSNPANSIPMATRASVPGTGNAPLNQIYISSITVNWGTGTPANPAVTKYICEVSTALTFTGSLDQEQPVTDTNATFQSLDSNTTYYFQVKARNHAGVETTYNTAWSAVTRVSPPGSLGLSPPTANSIAANWNAGAVPNPSGTDYICEISTSPTFATITNSQTTQGFNYNFNNLIQNTTYYFQVKAINRAGVASAYTTLGSATTLATAPSNLNWTNVYITSMSFTWTGGSGSGGYRIDASTSSDFGTVERSSTVPASPTNAAVIGLGANKQYYFRVGNLNVDSVPTWPAGYVSTATLAYIPGLGSITSRGGISISASWGPSGNPSGTNYILEASTKSNFTPIANSASVTATNGTVPGLNPDTLYYVRVKARNLNGIDTDYTSLDSTTTLTAPPQNLQFSGVWYSSASLTWTNPQPATNGFILDWSIFSDFSAKSSSDTADQNATTLTAPSDLNLNTTYYFQVGSRNAAGEISYAAALTTATLANAPLAATTPLTGVGPTNITATWTANNNPLPQTTYNVQASTRNDFPTANTISLLTSNFSQPFNSLISQTTYYLRVRALNHSNIPTSWVDLGSTTTFVTVSVSSQNMSPAEAMQDNEAVLLKLTPATNGSSLKWNSVSLQEPGTSDDSDIQEIRIYRDNPSSPGTFDPVGSAFPDIAAYVAGTRFTSGSATVNIAASEPLITTTPRDYFVVLKLASAATTPRTIQVRVPTQNSFNFTNGTEPGIWRVQGSFPYTSGQTTIQDSTTTVTLTGTNLAPSSIPRGTASVAMLKIIASANQGTANFNSVTLTRTGTTQNGDVSTIRIFRDNASEGTIGSFDGSDTEIANAPGFSGTTQNIAFSNQTITETASVNFFMVVDLPLSAVPDRYLGIRIAQNTDMGFTGQYDSATGAPLDSNLTLITDPPNILTTTISNYPAPATGTQGQKIPMLKLALSVDSDSAKWTGLRVNLAGTELSSDIREAQIYKENDSNTSFTGGDVLIGSSAFQNGSTNIYFLTQYSTQTIVSGQIYNYYLIYYIDPLALPGNTLTAQITNSSYLTIATPNTSISGVFPSSSSASTIQPTIDVVTVTPATPQPAPNSVIQGNTNISMARLKMEVDANAAVFTGLRLDKSGSCADTDVTAIKTWWDKNSSGNLEVDSDELVSSGIDTFSNGVVNLNLSLPQTIPVSPSYKYYFVSYSFSPTASVSVNCGLTLNTSSYVMLAAPDTIQNLNFPVSAQTTINEYADTIYVSTTSLAPQSVDPGTPNVPLFKLTLRTGFSQAPWKSVQFDRTGIAGLSDIGPVKLWLDRNANSTLDVTEDAPVLVSASFPTSGPVTMTITPNQIIDASTKTYFVTMDAPSSATPNKTFGLSVPTKDYFLTQSPNVVSPVQFPFQSGNVTINEPPSAITITPISQTPSEVIQGDTGKSFLALGLRTNIYNAYFNAITLERTGQGGTDLDISNIKFYADDGDGMFEPTTGDALLTSGNNTFSSGRVTLSFSQQTITTSQKYYFVALDINNAAQPNATLGLRLSDSSAISILSPDFAAELPQPGYFDSNLTTIQPTVDTLIVTMTSLPLTLKQGDLNKALAKISLKSDDRAVVLKSLLVNELGSLPATDVKEISLWRDSGNGSLDSGDTLLALTPQPFSTTNISANLTFNTPEIITTSSQLYFLAVSLSQTAAVNENLGLEIPDSSAFTVVEPDIVSASLWQSNLFTVNDYPDILTTKPYSMDIEGIYQGQEQTIGKLELSLNEDSAELATIKIKKSGTAPDSQVTGVRLYLDSNSNISWDKTSDALVAGPVILSNGMASFDLSTSLFTLSSATSTLFVTYTMVSNATPYRTIGYAIQDVSYIVLTGTDTSSSANLPFTSPLVLIKDARVPTKPKITLDGKYTSQTTRLHLKWNSSVFIGNIQDAEYAIGTSSAATDVRGWTKIGNTSDITLTGLALEHGRTYYVSVKTKSDSGFYSDTGASIGVTVDTLKPAVSQPPDVKAENGEIVLNWPQAQVGPSGLVGYKIEERNARTAIWNAVTPAPSATTPGAAPAPLITGNSYFVGSKPSGTYYYRVTAINGAGIEGEPSPATRVVVGPAPNAALSDAFCYPNPFDSRQRDVNIVYTLNQNTDTEAIIYDLLGSKVWSKTFAQGQEGGWTGTNTVTWDGTDSAGQKVPFDVYICVIKPKAGGETKIKIAVIH